MAYNFTQGSPKIPPGMAECSHVAQPVVEVKVEVKVEKSSLLFPYH
jgi:hypothetical protein